MVAFKRQSSCGRRSGQTVSAPRQRAILLLAGRQNGQHYGQAPKHPVFHAFHGIPPLFPVHSPWTELFSVTKIRRFARYYHSFFNINILVFTNSFPASSLPSPLRLYFSKKMLGSVQKKGGSLLRPPLFFSTLPQLDYDSGVSVAARYSRFIRAMFSSETPLGHSTSQAPVLEQFPKPSWSICATMLFTRRVASTRP